MVQNQITKGHWLLDQNIYNHVDVMFYVKV